MPDAFHDDVIRELSRLSTALEHQQRSLDEALNAMASLPCLDLGPNSHHVRLDRLEQSEERRQRVFARLWAAIAAMGAVLVGMIAERLR
jgi:hypothetical protein